MLRESRYNYEFSDTQGQQYICNGLSGTILRKPLACLTSASFSPDEQTFLRQHHFILDSDVDELDILLQRNRLLGEGDNGLELTLMLHEDCNFRCTYCFEDFINRKLDGNVLDDLVNFVNEKVPDEGSLSVHFYGGEPLLAWDSLVRVNSEFRSVLQRKQGRYRFFITTNGSLLTPDKAMYLAEQKVEHVKITLDGPPDVHDTRRKHGSGKGTFDSILRNLVHALPLFKIVLRVNLDSANIASIPKLLDIIERAQVNRQHLHIDYNIVHDGKSGELAPGITYSAISALQSDTLNRGFRLHLPPITRFRYCKFNSNNSYLVDTEGELFLCSKQPSFQIGSIAKNHAVKSQARSLPVINTNADVAAAFHNVKSACLACNLLPICGGGCTMLSLKTGKPPCPPWKEDYQSYLMVQNKNLGAS